MTDINELNIEIKVLRTELRTALQQLQEVRTSVQQLDKFMYETKGGWKWLFGLMTVSAALGGFASHLVNFFTIKLP